MEEESVAKLSNLTVEQHRLLKNKYKAQQIIS